MTTVQWMDHIKNALTSLLPNPKPYITWRRFPRDEKAIEKMIQDASYQVGSATGEMAIFITYYGSKYNRLGNAQVYKRPRVFVLFMFFSEYAEQDDIYDKFDNVVSKVYTSMNQYGFTLLDDIVHPVADESTGMTLAELRIACEDLYPEQS